MICDECGLALGLNGDIAEDLDLAGEAQIGILLMGAPQAEFFQESRGIDIGRWRDNDAISGA